MNDTKIVTEKELNYIETLYLYCNIEDFAKHEEHHPNYAYYSMMSYIKDTMLVNAELLGTAKGRDWYKLDNYTLGIMPYDTAKSANQYNCLIQYHHHHLFTLDKNLTSLDLPFGNDRSDYKIKRIDITKIAKHDEDYTKEHGYISPFKRKDNVNGTIYLGNRSNGAVFRIYNKTRELIETQNDKKAELLSRYFGDIENLYTYELELSRSYLKNELGIDSLSELNRVYSAYENIVGKIRFYEDNDKNKKLIKQGNRNRIKGFILTDFKEYKRVEKKRYKPSYNFLLEQIKKRIALYLATGIEENETEFYLKLMTDLTSELDIDGKEITFNFENSDLQVEKALFSSKVDLLRENQSNELELEANRAFGKISVAKKKPDVAVKI